MTATETRSRPLGVGVSAARPDGWAKTRGEFEFSSDLWRDGCLWLGLSRAFVPRARIHRIDTTPALAMANVVDVITAADIPGSRTFGIHHPDQPVFAFEEIRYSGEVFAAVAATSPSAARAGAEAVVIDYAEIEPLLDPEQALSSPPIHPDGNLVRRIDLVHGNTDIVGDVIVEGTYEVGIQDQAFLGPESGLAAPSADGGVELIACSQHLHADLRQVAACLALPEDLVHIRLGGIGGAFGGKEDINVHVPLALLAIRTGRPIKACFNREESFFGHVHRHPAKMWYRHHAAVNGTLLRVEARIMLDGGAYASTSAAVAATAATFAAGPYRVPSAQVHASVVRTNNPPAGAMRGFGAVQVCVGYEAQMDKLASALGMDPVELRLRNALEPGDQIITGQEITGAAPVRKLIETCSAAPLPPLVDPTLPETLPGGVGRTGDATQTRRGVGFALGFKNLMFSEGYDDYSTATCSLDRGVARIACAAVEMGQGFVTLAQQITREILGTETVEIDQASTRDGPAGSSSASRQSWMSGGAVAAACRSVRDKLIAEASSRWGLDAADLCVRDGMVVDRYGTAVASFEELGAVEATERFHHRQTSPLDERGQGDAHVTFAFVAHRAVVDVDVDLGLVRVVEVTTSQDCGRVLNPIQVLGQIEGGISQGVGLAVMEELLTKDGRVQNPSFTDYLIPTIVDMPLVRVASLVEEPEPGAPFGAKGVGEMPSISSTAAVVAAIRDAIGADLVRVPVRPEDILSAITADQEALR